MEAEADQSHKVNIPLSLVPTYPTFVAVVNLEKLGLSPNLAVLT